MTSPTRGRDVPAPMRRDKSGKPATGNGAGSSRPRNNERTNQMATKTKAIEVKVDERLAEAISDKAVKAWHATNYSNGRKRVYVTFEEVVSA